MIGACYVALSYLPPPGRDPSVYNQITAVIMCQKVGKARDNNESRQNKSLLGVKLSTSRIWHTNDLNLLLCSCKCMLYSSAWLTWMLNWLPLDPLFPHTEGMKPNNVIAYLVLSIHRGENTKIMLYIDTTPKNTYASDTIDNLHSKTRALKNVGLLSSFPIFLLRTHGNPNGKPISFLPL